MFFLGVFRFFFSIPPICVGESIFIDLRNGALFFSKWAEQKISIFKNHLPNFKCLAFSQTSKNPWTFSLHLGSMFQNTLRMQLLAKMEMFSLGDLHVIHGGLLGIPGVWIFDMQVPFFNQKMAGNLQDFGLAS